MAELQGGSRPSAIIAGIACTASFVWPIGTIIFGPTRAGMVFATIID